MSRIVIVRHGDTFAPGDTIRRIGARTDLPLTDNGRHQAERLAALVVAQGVRFGAVWCGPLRRHRDTAAILTAGQAVQPTVVDWLDEIDHGPDEGLPKSEVRLRHGPAVLDAWDREAQPPPGWLVDGDGRRKSWRAALAQQAGSPDAALAVTSNGAARFALAHPELTAAAAMRGDLKLRTGAYGVLAFDGVGWRIEAWDHRP